MTAPETTLPDPEAQRTLARDAWMAWWDIVVPDEGPVTVAMPWRTTIEVLKPLSAQETLFALPGQHRVDWVGFDPDRGLVRAQARWNPRREPRPLPPTEGWEDCDIAFLKQDGFVRARDGYTYRRLPMPVGLTRDQGVDRQIALRTHLDVQGVPISRFIEAAGLDRRLVAIATGRIATASNPQPDLILSEGLALTLRWFAGNRDDDSTPVPVVRLRRHQALASMPCFSGLVMRSDITADTVDTAGSLATRLAEAAGCSPSTIRILGKAAAQSEPPQLDAMRRMVGATNLLRIFDATPRDCLRAMAGSIGFNGWYQLFMMTTEPSRDPVVMDMLGRGLSADANGSWAWMDGSANRWLHLRDVAREFVRDLVWPAQASLSGTVVQTFDGQRAAETSTMALLASLGTARLARILDAHMAGALRRAAETVASTTSMASATWQIPAEPVTARTGQTVRFLSNAAELAHEGVMMGHCVGDYAATCAEGRCAIMSIGRWDGDTWQPSSTVDLRRGRDGTIQVSQHNGVRNTDPPADDAAVLAEWMAGLATGETVFDDAALPVRARSNNIADVHGEGWDTPEAAEARWDRWRRMLDVRQRTPGVFLQAAAARVLGAGISRSDQVNKRLGGLLGLAETVAAYDAALLSRRANAQASLAAPDTLLDAARGPVR